MESTSCFDPRTQFLPGQLVLNPRSVSTRRVTAPMVPLCFHLHSGLCRGQRSQLLHKTCCVCCCSLVLLLQDKHKEMALHWAHLCTQSAHRASHQTHCAFAAKVNFTGIAALFLMYVSVQWRKFTVSISFRLFSGTPVAVDRLWRCQKKTVPLQFFPSVL